MYIFIMGFLTKVKYNYYQNAFDDLKKNNQIKEITQLFDHLSKNSNDIYIDLLEKNIDELFSLPDFKELFSKNLIWLSSFQNYDLKIIHLFLSHYFNNENIVKLDKYADSVFQNSNSNISFEKLIQDSYKIQNRLSKKFDTLILENYSAFFASPNNKNFTHPFLTMCYIYVVRNPYDVYRELKLNNDNKDQAMNILLNLDQQNQKFIFDKNKYVELPIKSWDINLRSWTDKKVVDDYRGLILKYEEIFTHPFDFFSSIILHFINNGLNLNINYDSIKKFIDQNQTLFEHRKETDLSNKEIKQINRHISKTLNDLDLEYSPY